MRTIAPNERFEMVIHKPEYYNSLVNYNIEIESGLFTDSDYVFTEIIEAFWNIRQRYPKGTAMNLVDKFYLILYMEYLP